jgi:hypothetical protein
VFANVSSKVTRNLRCYVLCLREWEGSIINNGQVEQSHFPTFGSTQNANTTRLHEAWFASAAVGYVTVAFVC